MSNYLVYKDGVSCRCCGATHAAPRQNQWGLCSNCYNAARHKVRGEPDDSDISEFLARQLVVKGRRLARGKRISRCQCVSYLGSDPNNQGYQCGNVANFERDGREVCWSHNNSPSVVFVDDYAPDPWASYREMLRSLCELRPDFKDVLRRVVEE